MLPKHWSRIGKGSVVALLVFLVLGGLPGQSQADPFTPPGGQNPAIDSPHPFVPPLRPPAAGALATPAVTNFPTYVSDPVLDMRVLVLHWTEHYEEGIYDTARAYLDILGVPFTSIDVLQPSPEGTIEESDLWDGANHGYYYAIIVTTSLLWYEGLTADERAIIEAYERSFRVRQVTLYAYPDPTTYGLVLERVVAANNDPVWCPGFSIGIPFNAALTEAGRTELAYLKPDISLAIDGPCMYGYLARPAPGANITSLMQDPSDATTFLAIYRPGDGREHLVMTMGSFYPAIPPAYIHARALPYGMITWATRGRFLGERHLYFVPQPDDVFSYGTRWDPVAHVYTENPRYRLEANDLDNLALWMADFKTTQPNAAGFRIEMPFNAEEPFDGVPPEVDPTTQLPIPGTLTAEAALLQSHFTWLNHTYTHEDLSTRPYNYCSWEIGTNTTKAGILGLQDYSTVTLLTGDYSGINPPNPALAEAAYDRGVRFIEVNASQPGYNNPTPNTGIPHPTQPAILQVPRYATNVFFAPTNQESETDLYNWIYCPGYQANPDPAYRCYDYDTIVANITNQALGFMLDYSVNATMFHMNNVDSYDEVFDGSGRTLMTDFVEALYGKYNALFNTNVPVLSLRTQETGQRMRDRMAYNASGVKAELACGDQITLHTEHAAQIPLTGVTYGTQVESYAGQSISTIAMGDNATVVIPGAAAATPAAINDLTAIRSSEDVVLTWSPTTQDTQGQPLGALVYRVYGKAGDPEFTPTPADLLAEVASPTYTHLGAAGSSEITTYVVTAVGNNCWKRESAPSNRLTKFAWTVRPGYNLLSMPLLPSDVGIQAVLSTQLFGGDRIDTGDRVLKFDPTTQQYDQIAVYVDGTGTPYDGYWYDVTNFPNTLSPMTLSLHDGFWIQHRSADTRLTVVFGRAASAPERSLVMTLGPFQLFGTAAVGTMALNNSNLWESGASGGDRIDTGDRILRFDASTQTYDAIAVLIDGTNTGLDGAWADGFSFPNPSQLNLEPGRGYWFENRAPASAFSWTYPRP